MSDIRIEFVVPIEIPMSSLQEYLAEYMDIPHLGAHKERINKSSASWDGQELDRDDHHERAEATFDRAPSYLEFDSYDQDLFEETAGDVVRLEQERDLATMARFGDNLLWRTLHHAYLSYDLTAGEADRMYLALAGAEDLVGLIDYR